ncbi:hypothetical protein CBR_g40982 [Chara braunii]|uniref:Uncharacterized protein n=1 Tax=Chara braunii TaxID=69332 RepID=A0A388LUT2_CHABU|nr:hypothetical protein CBR_g40982 [Chara braunii]|eukprot:GBG86080.1 hypothetical protein CBR_g40982 [Chara braunii]
MSLAKTRADTFVRVFAPTPQPPSGGQHPGGGGRGDGGDGVGPGGGGDGGDGSGSGGDEAKGKGPGETSSEPEDSGRKRSGEKGSGGKGSGGKGPGGKGPSGKGPSGKRRAFGSHESSGTGSRCEGSRDSGMRDKAALRSYRVRVHLHLSARTLFHDAGERKVLEGPAAGVLETRPGEYDRYTSEGASIDFLSKSAADPGKEELSQDAHAVHREEETQHWPPSRVPNDLDAGVLETGASGHLRHPSEGASVDLERKSAPPRGKGELSLREAAKADASEHQCLSGNAINIGDADLVLHSGSPLTTQEGDVKGGHETFGEARLRGEEEGEEEPVVEIGFMTMRKAKNPWGRLSFLAVRCQLGFMTMRQAKIPWGELNFMLVRCRLGFMTVRCRLVRWVRSGQIVILSPPAAVKSKVIERPPSVSVGKWCFMKPRSWLAIQLPSSWLAIKLPSSW